MFILEVGELGGGGGGRRRREGVIFVTQRPYSNVKESEQRKSKTFSNYSLAVYYYQDQILQWLLISY